MLKQLDDRIRFRTATRMLVDGVDEIVRAAIVKEEDALAKSPKWSGTELVSRGAALRDAVGKIIPHVVNEKIGVKIRVHVVEAWSDRRRAGLQCRRVA